MKKTLLTLGVLTTGALALPAAMPTAHAEGVRIALNLNAPAVYQPAPRVVYGYGAPRPVVVVAQPRHRHGGWHGHGPRQAAWAHRPYRTAWRY